MKKQTTAIQSLAFLLCAIMLLTSCITLIDSGSADIEEIISISDEEVSRVEIQVLFEATMKEIIALATEDPISHIMIILGDDVEIFYEDVYIGDKLYYKTAAAYKTLRDYYAELFTGEALAWVLSTKFAEVDNLLYCSPIGGATGWRIENTGVEILSQNGNRYTCEASFNRADNTGTYNPQTCLFIVEKTETGCRISYIDYIPDLLES